MTLAAVDHLIELGRQRGGLGIDDLRRALPIDAMTIEEISGVLARLEEAGISLEIDRAMLTPRHHETTFGEVKSTTQDPGPREPNATAHNLLSNQMPSMKQTEKDFFHVGGPAQVKGSNAVFIVVAGLILCLLALGVWFFA